MSYVDIVMDLAPNHENEDCSECADRVVAQIKGGSIVTILALDSHGKLLDFITPDESGEHYLYHTVVKFDGCIIDITCKEKIFKISSYKALLVELNPKAVSFIVSSGHVDPTVLTSRTLKVNTEINKSEHFSSKSYLKEE